MLEQISFSDHAVTRMAQRRLTADDVMYVMLHGRQHRCGGALHIFLGKRDIPANDQRNDRFARLEGVTVLVDSKRMQTVITVYRNREASRAFVRKAKYDLKRGSLKLAD